MLKSTLHLLISVVEACTSNPKARCDATPLSIVPELRARNGGHRNLVLDPDIGGTILCLRICLALGLYVDSSGLSRPLRRKNFRWSYVGEAPKGWGLGWKEDRQDLVSDGRLM